MKREFHIKSSMPEKQLMTRLIMGEEKAYAIIYEKYYVYLCRIANEFVSDDFIAETIVGDVIFNFWKIRENLDTEVNLKAYLVRSVKNRSINYLQQEYVKREKRFANNEYCEIIQDLLYIDTIQPEELMIQEELHNHIDGIVAHFPVECRNVFEKSRFDGKKYDEIADEMNISVNTVKYHIKSALSKLRVGLKEYL